MTALTAASEVVSFTKVIQRTPPLHWLDMLGRRPAHAASPASGLVRKNATPVGWTSGRARAGWIARPERERPRASGPRHLRPGCTALPVTAPAAERGAARQPGRGMGRAAAVIGVLTVASGVVGFGRQLVFAHTVGASCVGTAYTTANQVPNIIYDIVLGGALTSAVVPVLAGPASRGPDGAAQTRQIASALLTWALLLLVPVAAVVAPRSTTCSWSTSAASRTCCRRGSCARSTREAQKPGIVSTVRPRERDPAAPRPLYVLIQGAQRWR